EIVIGTVPLIPDPGNRTLEFPDGVPVVDTANMTNGNSAPLFVLGEGNNDRFEVNHNRGKLFLHGGSGNDRFLLRTFLVMRENPEDNQEVTNLATLFGGAGTNRYDYLQNAPVFINGGPGIDTIVVIGTPIGDTFIITDVSIVGAGRITTFLNIESIEVDGAGGPDTIWIMSTAQGMSTTVIGGGGDDTIHLGGTPPPLVLDPPPFVYTPPPIVIEQPPEIVFDEITRFAGGLTVTTDKSFFDIIQSFFGFDSNWVSKLRALDIAVRTAQTWLDAARSQVPYFRNPSIKIAGIEVLDGAGNLRTDLGDGSEGTLLDTVLDSIQVNERATFSFLFIRIGTTVESFFPDFVVSYEAGRTVAVQKLIQPQPIIVDPAPFVYVATPVYDLTKIRGRLTIIGNEAVETNGDRLVIHNQDGSSQTSLLVNRVAPRRIEDGADQNGNPIYANEFELETGRQLFNVYLSLEGLGIPTGVGLDGVPFFGIEIFNMENIDLRLSGGFVHYASDGVTVIASDDGNDDLTIATEEYRGVFNNPARTLRAEELPSDLPDPEEMWIQVVAGAGNDTINLRQYFGQMVVLGGAGVDTVNVGHRDLLNGVKGTLTYDGDADIVEAGRQANATDYGAILNDLPNVFIGTDPTNAANAPVAVIDRSGNVFVFTNPVLSSIVFGSEPQPHRSSPTTPVTGDLWVRAVALHEVNVQEFGVH
ncbi:MAG TPA: hypothetical protein VGK49_01775, partial [Ilumatobacteraceae bacterium]